MPMLKGLKYTPSLSLRGRMPEAISLSARLLRFARNDCIRARLPRSLRSLAMTYFYGLAFPDAGVTGVAVPPRSGASEAMLMSM